MPATEVNACFAESCASVLAITDSWESRIVTDLRCSHGRSRQVLLCVRKPGEDGASAESVLVNAGFQATTQENDGCRDNRRGGFQRF